jgi:isoleucyl-tRNA synthetase
LTFSAQANYTDLATATERRNLVSTFADWVMSRSRRGGTPRPLISVF